MKERTVADLVLKDLTIEEVRLILKMEGPYSPIFNVGDDNWTFGYKAVSFEYYWICLTFVFQNGMFIYILLYFIQSMQGLI